MIFIVDTSLSNSNFVTIYIYNSPIYTCPTILPIQMSPVFAVDKNNISCHHRVALLNSICCYGVYLVFEILILFRRQAGKSLQHCLLPEDVNCKTPPDCMRPGPTLSCKGKSIVTNDGHEKNQISHAN